MYVLAIDPGVNTGIVLMTADDIVWALTSKGAHEVRSALTSYPDADVVIEDVPTTHCHNKEPFEEVKSVVTSERDDITWVRPSQWKGHPASRLSDDDKSHLSTKHEREAASLGRWYLSTRRNDVRANAESAGGNA